jgi:Tol biopolymer transport system component
VPARTAVTIIAASIGATMLLWLPSRALASCSNESLRSETHSTLLPECRAFELVTPPYLDGYTPGTRSLSPDGSRLLFESSGTFSGAEGSSLSLQGTEYEAQRMASGWSTRPLNPPSSSFPFAIFEDASVDSSKTLWLARKTGQSVDENDLYVREPDGALVLVGPELPQSALTGPPGATAAQGDAEFLRYAGSAGDLSRVFFLIKPRQTEGEESKAWPGDTTTTANGLLSLYEYAGRAQSEPKLVGVRNEGLLHSNKEAELITQCGVQLGSAAAGGSEYNAISTSQLDEGGVVFFSAGAGGCGSPPGTGPAVEELYARVDEAHTVPISEPSLSVPGRECSGVCREDETEEGGHHRSPGTFQGASRDGSKVFFTTNQPLVNSDEGGSGEGTDLYQANLEAGGSPKITKLVQLSRDPNPGEAANVRGVSRISEDGSRVYFVAMGVLTTAPNGLGQKASAGADNMYVVKTDTGATSFVATLAPEDEEDWRKQDFRPVQTTSDGRFLAFESRVHLTSDDESGAEVHEVFEYDAQSGTITRVSIGQHSATGFFCATIGKVQEGYNCNGNTSEAERAPFIGEPGFAGPSTPSGGQQLSLSSDGSAVIFVSADALAPEAVNSLGGVCFNVYEYRSTGGDIRHGNVFLLSDGQDLAQSESICGSPSFITDPSAQDVLVFSADQLVAQDSGTQREIYDARVGGGFPAPSAAPGCQGEVCQGGVAPAPSLPSLGSVTQPGGDNLPPSSASPPRAPPKKKPQHHKHKSRRHAKPTKRSSRHKHKSARPAHRTPRSANRRRR